MNIQSIELKHTNPSMGPHETITTITLAITAKHDVMVNEFLDQAIINQTTSMRTYLEGVQSNDGILLERITANSPKSDLRCGESISHLTFYFKDSTTIVLHDVYREYRLTNFYPTFTKYMVDNGVLNKYSGWDRPNLGTILPPEPLDFSSEKIEIPPTEE